jgi:hypothetical protein
MAALSAKALLLLLLGSVAALQAPCTLSRRAATHLAAVSLAELAEQSSLPPADKSRITVLTDADAVGAEVWKRIDEAGKRAVEERGTFTLAIPGGSVLKMLAGTKPAWAEDCLLAYVNHKAVDDDADAAFSTHAKARAGFLDAGWDGVDVLNLGGSSDAVAEACRYAELLELATQQNLLPVAATASGETIPVFDMMVIVRPGVRRTTSHRWRGTGRFSRRASATTAMSGRSTRIVTSARTTTRGACPSR